MPAGTLSTASQAIGFGRTDDSPITLIRFPHPRELIATKWAIKEREAVASYLASGVSIRAYFGFADCRFPDGPNDGMLGTDDFSDGMWVWPQCLEVYVRGYAVRLPEGCLEHARSNGYRIPKNLSDKALAGHAY